MSASDFLNGSIANEHLPRTTPTYWEMAAKKGPCTKKRTSEPTKKCERKDITEICPKNPTSEPECDKKKNPTSEPQKKKK